MLTGMSRQIAATTLAALGAFNAQAVDKDGPQQDAKPPALVDTTPKVAGVSFVDLKDADKTHKILNRPLIMSDTGNTPDAVELKKIWAGLVLEAAGRGKASAVSTGPDGGLLDRKQYPRIGQLLDEGIVPYVDAHSLPVTEAKPTIKKAQSIDHNINWNLDKEASKQILDSYKAAGYTGIAIQGVDIRGGKIAIIQQSKDNTTSIQFITFDTAGLEKDAQGNLLLNSKGAQEAVKARMKEAVLAATKDLPAAPSSPAAAPVAPKADINTAVNVNGVTVRLAPATIYAERHPTGDHVTWTCKLDVSNTNGQKTEGPVEISLYYKDKNGVEHKLKHDGAHNKSGFSAGMDAGKKGQVSLKNWLVTEDGTQIMDPKTGTEVPEIIVKVKVGKEEQQFTIPSQKVTINPK